MPLDMTTCSVPRTPGKGSGSSNRVQPLDRGMKRLAHFGLKYCSVRIRTVSPGGGGRLLPQISYTSMCRCEG